MATPHIHLEERAKKLGIDPNARDVIVDDGNLDREFRLRFKPYIEPKDIDSVAETAATDKENEERYKFNLTQMPVLNILLARMLCNWKLSKPPNFNTRALGLWKTKINEPAYKTVEAVKLLATNGKFAVKDYAIEEAAKLADDFVVKRFLEEQTAKTNVHISIRELASVPKDHHQVCDCNYTWDGKSPTCASRNGKRRLRLTWRTKDDHHFLNPQFEPFCY